MGYIVSRLFKGFFLFKVYIEMLVFYVKLIIVMLEFIIWVVFEYLNGSYYFFCYKIGWLIVVLD